MAKSPLERAFAVAEQADRDQEHIQGAEKKGTDPRGKNKSGRAKGRRGRVRRGYVKNHPLEGVKNEDMRDRIMKVVALEYSGITDDEIADMLDVTKRAILATREHHPSAFEDARKIHLAEASRQYHMNLYLVKAALSKAGPKAVEVLAKVMIDSDVAPGVRVKAAETVLKLLGAGEKVQVQAGIARDYLDAVTGAIESDAEDKYIVNADYEVVE